MRLIRLALVLALTGASAGPAFADIEYFTEDFSDNSAGWTLGTEWQIGPTSVSSGGNFSPDPEFDHTPTSDNGVAGTILGGNITTVQHGFYYLESPPIDLSGANGTVQLKFWRWLNLDSNPQMEARVEVFDGTAWITVFRTGEAYTTDYDWTLFTYDVTAYKNVNFRVRFGHRVGSFGAFTVSGWNVDDVSLSRPCTTEVCNGLDEDCDGIVDNGCNYLTIESIRDVGNDQGRNVRVRWIRSSFDSLGLSSTISLYSVWRRVDGAGPAAGPGARVDAAAPGDAEFNDLPPGSWDFIASVPALNLQRYQLVSPTLCDSNTVGLCWSVFLVRAHFSPPSSFEDAPLDSGYSVDNIVPGVPQNLTANATQGGNALDWSDAADSDFQYFRIYRGTSPGFPPGPGSFVHSTAASGWTDPSGGVFVYKVTTVDANGNESPPATAAITVSVADGAEGRLGFASIAPNPFRGEVSCAIVVPSGGARVELRVHDLAGRVVRTLASSPLEAGRHTLVWDGRDASGRRAAPGIYLFRLAADGRSSVRRVAFTP